MAISFTDWEGTCLIHHGVKGQKWGIRRYQNPDGTLTEWGKSRNRTIKTAKTKSEVDEIFNTLSKKEKRFVGGYFAARSKEWLSLDEGENVVKRFLKRDGDKPLAFLDIIEGGGRETGKRYEIGIATRSGRKYRGKGHASELVKKAVNWINRHPDIMDKEVLWIADPDNVASNNMARRFGFDYDEERSSKKRDNYYTVKRV